VTVNKLPTHTVARTYRQLLFVLCNNDYTSDFNTRRSDELLQGPDRSVLRGRVRRTGQSCRRRRDQGLAGLHEAVRKSRRGKGVEQRPSPGQLPQVFPQRGPVRPAGQGPEE